MSQVDVKTAIDEHYSRIYRAALVLTGNPWDADDLAQETFLVLARDGQKFEGRSNLYTWLYGILLNLERRQLRRLGTLRRKLRVIRDQETADTVATPPAETRLEVREWKTSLWAKVAELPEGQRQALVLRFAEHLSYQEVAEALNCPLGTVKSRIFNGLARLRDLLAEDSGQVTHPPRHASEDLTEVG